LVAVGTVACHHHPHGTRVANPAQGEVDGRTTLVNEHYCFELQAPGTRWSFAESDEQQRLTNNVVATAQRRDPDAQGMVAVLPLPQDDLEQTARRMHESAPYQNARIIEWRATEYAGQPAFQSVIGAKVQGIPLLFERVLVAHQGHLFVVAAWTAEGELHQARAAMAPFFRAFRFRPGQLRETFAVADLRELQTDDYVIADRRFQSAATGLTLAPSAQWRFLTGPQLATVNESAHIGLTTVNPSATFVVVAEALPQSARPHFAQRVFGELEDEGLREIDDVVTVQVQSRPLRLRGLGDQVEGLFVGTFCRDRLCYQLLLLCPRQARRQAQRLADSLPNVQFMEEAARQELAQRLSRQARERRVVGPNYLWTDHRFTHFDGGLSLHLPLPPLGLYSVALGDGAARRSQNSVFWLEELRAGLGVNITLVQGDDVAGKTLETLHHEVVQGIAQSQAAGTTRTNARPLAHPLLLGSTPALLSDVNMPFGQGDQVTLRLITARQGHRVLLANMWARPEHLREHQSWFEQVVQGLRLHARPLDSVEHGDHNYVNHLLGVELQLPGPPWRVQELQPNQTSAHVGVLCRRDEIEWLVLAQTAREAHENAPDDESQLQETESAAPLAGGTTSRTAMAAEELNGLPALFATYGTREGSEIYLWIVRRPGMVYRLFVQGTSEAQARQLVQGFALR
jgi:hypothetical protein